MIPALIALLTAIFFGGEGNIFYVDDLEKGVKKHVENKEVRKEIKKDLKSTEKIFKAFNKERKQDFKEFIELYNNQQTTSKELNSFFETVQNKRVEHQKQIVDKRLLVFEKIKDGEWEAIVASSETVSEKRLAKAKKKAKLEKPAFPKTRKALEKHILGADKLNNSEEALDDFVASLLELEKNLIAVNVNEDKILADKESGKEEPLDIFIKENEIRHSGFETLISFHSHLKSNCSPEQWPSIIKAFTKELETSSR